MPTLCLHTPHATNHTRSPGHLSHQVAHPWIVTVHRTPEGEVRGVLVVSEDKTERRLTFRW